MLWAGRINDLSGDMNPLEGMPLSLVGYQSMLLVCSSIQRPVKSVILRIKGDKNQKNRSFQKIQGEI